MSYKRQNTNCDPEVGRDFIFKNFTNRSSHFRFYIIFDAAR